MKPKPFKSKLNPYCKKILILRKAGISFERILKWLKEEKNIVVGKTTLFSFVARRQNKRTAAKYRPLSELFENMGKYFNGEQVTSSETIVKTAKKSLPQEVSQIDIQKILNNHK